MHAESFQEKEGGRGREREGGKDGESGDQVWEERLSVAGISSEVVN